MKKLFTSAFVILLTIGAAQAQTTFTEKQKDHKKEHRMGGYESLNLTADQKARLQAAKEQYKKDAAALKSTTGLTEEQQKARKKELHQQHKTEVEAIFTPEQKSQLDKMRAERKEAGKAAKKGVKRGQKDAARSGKRGNGIHEQLSLSADQQTKVQQIRTDFRSKLQSLRNDKALTSEQKKAKRQELLKDQQTQMKAVLSKEQQQKMESLRKERAARNTK